MKKIAIAEAVLILAAVVVGTSLGQGPEQQAPRGAGRDGRPRGPFNPLIRLLDVDQDGVLSADEIQKASAKLKSLDANKDGKLSDDELRRSMGPGFGGPREGRFQPGGARDGQAPPDEPRGGGPSPGGPSGGQGRMRTGSAQFDLPPTSKDDAERKIQKTLDEMRRGRHYANVSPTDGRLLRLLAESIGAKRVVEIGTSSGVSAIWLALALRTTDGHLITHEIDPEIAKIAQENFQKAGVADRITLVLGDAHETLKQHKEPIDLLFLDADKEGYVDYLQKLLPLVRPGGLIIAHNMNPGQADSRYVEAITKDPKLETSFLLMDGAGVGVTLKKR